MLSLLKFGAGNGKLDDAIDTFSLPAGWTCPGACGCLAKADRATGKIEDGAAQQYRCFAASVEARCPNVRKALWNNYELLRTAGDREGMAELILASIPHRQRTFDIAIDGKPFKNVIRLHVHGDFFSQAYFDAWLTVTKKRSDVLVYGYTKALPLWVKRLAVVPANFVLTASYGGKWDHIIPKHNLRSAQVVFSEAEAVQKGMELDHDDSHAMRRGPSFALLIHGEQRAGPPASKAVAALRSMGESGDGRKAERIRPRHG